MAFAKKCDRCGRLYEGYNIKPSATNINGVITANIDYFGKYYTQNILDLCPECSDSFMRWLSKENDVKEDS